MKQKVFDSNALFDLIKSSYINAFPAPNALIPLEIFNDYLKERGIKGNVSYGNNQCIFNLQQATNTSNPGAMSPGTAQKNAQLEIDLSAYCVAGDVIEDLINMIEWMREEGFFTPDNRASLKLLNTNNI